MLSFLLDMVKVSTSSKFRVNVQSCTHTYAMHTTIYTIAILLVMFFDCDQSSQYGDNALCAKVCTQGAVIHKLLSANRTFDMV